MTKQEAKDTLEYMRARCPYNQRMQEAIDIAIAELTECNNLSSK